MSSSPNKRMSVQELITGNDTIREDVVNENLVSSTRGKDFEEEPSFARRQSASEKKASSKHVERIRNSYQKKKAEE